MIGLPTVSAAVIRLQVDPVGHPSASSRKGAMSRSLDRHRYAVMVPRNGDGILANGTLRLLLTVSRTS